MNKRQLQSEQTKRRIAELTRPLFVQKGFAGTSIEDIVAATGSSKGNIYYHFENKEGLFLYLFDEWDREWEEQWEIQERQYGSTADKMYGFVHHLIENELNHPLIQAADEFFGQEWVRSDIQERILQMIEKRVRFNQGLLQQGMDQGEFKPDDAGLLGIIFESLLIGLSEMSRKCSLEDTIRLYSKSISVFLHGIMVKTQ
ncbi:TetR/AcrR family transcriptional regulator [Paenibacillus sp. GCM10027626]|uniref:TetR/AcrR family transcriptional regulator n=1 Tax=Paenibacillus sp. GCM10027626 TaxID=3273411 RepID=UPI0036355301